MTKFSDDLAWRGLIKDKTFGQNDWLDEPRTFYLGIDASGDSLTIGNLAVIILARRFVEAGWKAVLLAGGATSLVGDPGGKEEERALKTKEEIAGNVEAVKNQVERLFAGQPHEMVNNLDWLGEVKFLDFLRDVGKNYSMTELLQRDFVSARIGEGGSGISYAEFSYSLLQGYDFWWLHKNKGVVLQIGASDQWGNMLSGVPLVRKKENQEVHAMSMPLVINTATGRKFGKSEEGAVWLDPAKTSPTAFYQFWINADDADVENYLKVFTFFTPDEITSLMKLQQANPQDRAAQKKLALAVTSLVHGDQAAAAAEAGAASLKTVPSDTSEAEFVKVKSGTPLVSALVDLGLCSSNTEARRLLDEGAIYINNEPSATELLDRSDYAGGKLALRRGKKYQNTVLVELT